MNENCEDDNLFLENDDNYTSEELHLNVDDNFASILQEDIPTINIGDLKFESLVDHVHCMPDTVKLKVHSRSDFVLDKDLSVVSSASADCTNEFKSESMEDIEVGHLRNIDSYSSKVLNKNIGIYQANNIFDPTETISNVLKHVQTNSKYHQSLNVQQSSATISEKQLPRNYNRKLPKKILFQDQPDCTNSVEIVQHPLTWKTTRDCLKECEIPSKCLKEIIHSTVLDKAELDVNLSQKDEKNLKYSHLICPCSVILQDISLLGDLSGPIIIQEEVGVNSNSSDYSSPESINTINGLHNKVESGNSVNIMNMKVESDNLCAMKRTRSISASSDLIKSKKCFLDDLITLDEIKHNVSESAMKTITDSSSTDNINSSIESDLSIKFSPNKKSKRKLHLKVKTQKSKCKLDLRSGSKFDGNIRTVLSEPSATGLCNNKVDNEVQNWSTKLFILEREKINNAFFHQINLLKRLEILQEYQKWIDSKPRHPNLVEIIESQNLRICAIQKRLFLLGCNNKNSTTSTVNNSTPLKTLKQVKNSVTEQEDMLLKNCGAWCDGLKNYDVQLVDHSNKVASDVAAKHNKITSDIQSLDLSLFLSNSDESEHSVDFNGFTIDDPKATDYLTDVPPIQNCPINELGPIFVWNTEHGEIASNVDLGFLGSEPKEPIMSPTNCSSLKCEEEEIPDDLPTVISSVVNVKNSYMKENACLTKKRKYLTAQIKTDLEKHKTQKKKCSTYLNASLKSSMKHGLSNQSKSKYLSTSDILCNLPTVLKNSNTLDNCKLIVLQCPWCNIT